MKRVVISGWGVVAPVGIGKATFWQNLQNGISGATTLANATSCNLFGHHEFGAQVVCEVANFDPSANHVPSVYQSADRFVQFAFAAAHQAFHDARLHTTTW